jgi:hypothetical protein
MISRQRIRSGPRRPFASFVRLLALLPLILLLQGTQFASGTHEHADGHASESCPVCVHAHAPAIETTGQPATSAPSVSALRPHTAPAEAPAEQAVRLAPSRAPPLA